jgi:hypothetical protein
MKLRLNQPKKSSPYFKMFWKTQRRTAYNNKIIYKFMKNLFFGLIAIVLITNLSFAQNKVTIEVAKQIGSLHNEYVAQGIQNTPQTVSKLKDNFMNIKVDGVDDNIKNQTIEFFTQNDINKQEEIIMSSLKSEDAQDLYNSTKNIIINAKDFSQVSKDLDAKEVEASKLQGREQEMLYTLIETSRSSLNFWMPKSAGGQGGGNEYTTSTSKINWGAIGYADGMGALGVLMRTWYMAEFGPLSWGAILGAIGWGAAYGSGVNLLWQLYGN